MIGKLPLSCLMKGMPFPFISVACRISIAIYHLKYFVLIGPEILHIAQTTTDVINMIKRVNLFSIRMKIQCSEFPVTFHYWKRYLRHTLKYFISLQKQPINLLKIIVSIYCWVHKKWSFPSKISPVNVTKSTGNWGFGHIYWRSP